MQKCSVCGKAIRYIFSKGNVIICNAEEKTVYTESGRKVVGCEVHDCKKEVAK